MGKYKGQIKMEEKDWKNKVEKIWKNKGQNNLLIQSVLTRDKWSGSVDQTYPQ